MMMEKVFMPLSLLQLEELDLQSLSYVERQIEFDEALVGELAESLVTDYLHAYREAVANAYDADSAKIDIHFDSQKIIFEDYGLGSNDIDPFCAVGSPHKKETLQTSFYKRKPIGQKGLGFLSFFKLGKTVKVSINNGLFGYQVVRDRNKPLIAKTITGAKDAFLSHRGVKVEVTLLKTDAEQAKIEHYLKQYFSLIMSRGFSITVNGKKLDSGTRQINYEVKTKFGRIIGHYRHRGGGVVDVYCRGMWVKKILVDATRNFNAWVDCDFIIPNSGRDDFVKDNAEWEAFFANIKAYGQKFPKTHEEVAPKFEKAIGKVMQALGKVATELGMTLNSKMPVIPANNKDANMLTEQRKKAEVAQEPKPSNNPKGNPDSLHTKNQPSAIDNIKGIIKVAEYNGIKISWASMEGQLNPVIPQTPNELIINQSSEIFDKMDVYSRNHNSSAVILLIPYIARAYTQLVMDVTEKEINQEKVDQVAHGLYRKMVHASTPNVPTNC